MFKDHFLVFGRDPDPGISHIAGNGLIFRWMVSKTDYPGIGKFDRVIDQVRKDLFENKSVSFYDYLLAREFLFCFDFNTCFVILFNLLLEYHLQFIEDIIQGNNGFINSSIS